MMGRRFYEGDVPRIADALERIASALDALAADSKRQERHSHDAVAFVRRLLAEIGDHPHGFEDLTLAAQETLFREMVEIAGRAVLTPRAVQEDAGGGGPTGGS